MKISRYLKSAALSIATCLCAASNAQAADKLTLVFTTSAATFALPVLVAQEKGWLDANIMVVGGDANGLRALLSGTGDITFPGPFTVLSAASQGAKITAIGSWQGVADYDFIVGKDINAMQELEDKVYAGTGPSGAPEEYGKLLMRKYGVDTSKIKFIALNQGHADIVNAVVAGRASAGMANALSSQVGVRTGKMKILTTVAKEYPQIGYIYSVVRSSSVEDPNLKPKLQQFVTASIKASRFIMDHPDEAAKIMQAHFPDLDKSVVTDTIQNLNESKVWGVNGGMSPEQVAGNLDIFQKNKMLPGDTKLMPETFNYQFIDTALKQLGTR